MNYTDKELKVIEADGSFDGVWFFTDEMRVEGLSQKALGGVLSSLEQKGVVVCECWDGDNMAILKDRMEEL